MPAVDTEGKHGIGTVPPRGIGHPNLLLIKDFGPLAGGDRYFRAETEIHVTKANEVDFRRLEELLAKQMTGPVRGEIVKILHRLVDALRSDPVEAQKAKNMFAAAFDMLPKQQPLK